MALMLICLLTASHLKILSYSVKLVDKIKSLHLLQKIYKTGLIGIVLDILIFLVPGYYSIKYSKNDFSKLIGMLCAINYVLYFIEIPIGLNIDYFVIYLIIGIASLKKSEIKII